MMGAVFPNLLHRTTLPASLVAITPEGHKHRYNIGAARGAWVVVNPLTMGLESNTGWKFDPQHEVVGWMLIDGEMMHGIPMYREGADFVSVEPA